MTDERPARLIALTERIKRQARSEESRAGVVWKLCFPPISRLWFFRHPKLPAVVWHSRKGAWRRHPDYATIICRRLNRIEFALRRARRRMESRS